MKKSPNQKFFPENFPIREGDEFSGVREMKHEPLSSANDGRKFEPLAYSIEEAAAMLGISRGKLYRIMNVGEIGGKKLGRRTIILHSDLVKFLDNLPDYDDENNFD